MIIMGGEERLPSLTPKLLSPTELDVSWVLRCEVKVCIVAVRYCSTGWKCVIINVVLPVCCVTSDKVPAME